MSIAFQIALVVASSIAVVTHGRTFWEEETECNNIRSVMKDTGVVGSVKKVHICIGKCFKETTRSTDRAFSVTPKECFTDIMEPYITKVRNITIPTQDKINRCLATDDRSNCSDILFYYFAKWYKSNFDVVHHRRFAKFLFHAWAHHPDIPHNSFSINWEYTLGRDLWHLKFETESNIEEPKKVTSLSDPEQFSVIHHELERYCFQQKQTDKIKDFCKLRILMTIADKIRVLASNKQEYSRNLEKSKEAVHLTFFAVSALYPEVQSVYIQPQTEEGKVKVFDRLLNELAEFNKAGNTMEILMLLQIMPESYILNKACQQTDFPSIAQRSCILEKVQEQLLIHSKMAEKRKSSTQPKTVSINYSLNIKGIITELRGEEIFNILLQQRYSSVSQQEELTNLIEGKFFQLQGYFTKLQSFNVQKASADVAYIKGMIDHYRGKVKTATGNVGEHVGGVLKAAVIAKGAEVAYNIINLAVTIAQACNPFDIILNGGSATDIMDATSKLSTSISELVGAVALKRDWTNALNLINEISRGLRKNSEFLGAVGKIVKGISLKNFPDDEEFEVRKSTFLRLYNAYTPEVDAVKLARLETKLDTTVSSACDIINSVETTGAAEYVAYVRDNLYCPKAAESINVMVTLYQEIYEHQFELIESMATYLQSATGYHAAKQMVTLAGTPLNASGKADDKTQVLRAQIIMAHTTYEMQKQSAVQSFCDFLEYKAGGTTPEICKTYPVDIPTLLSYIPRRCKSIIKYVSIPITTSSKVQPGYVNIKALYRGEELSFSVPSYEWLKENHWVDEEDNLEAVYIRNFEIFLPTITKDRTRIRVTAESIGKNQFKPKGVRYSLIPNEKYYLDYEQGQRFSACSGRKTDHPYSICEKRRLPKVCVLGDKSHYMNPQTLYPSIFAGFRIKAKGVNDSQTPDPASPLDLKARVNLCFFEDKKKRKKRESNQKDIPGCCKGNTFWSQSDKSCKDCGGMSKSNLKGYYCEKNLKAIY